MWSMGWGVKQKSGGMVIGGFTKSDFPMVSWAVLSSKFLHGVVFTWACKVT